MPAMRGVRRQRRRRGARTDRRWPAGICKEKAIVGVRDGVARVNREKEGKRKRETTTTTTTSAVTVAVAVAAAMTVAVAETPRVGRCRQIAFQLGHLNDEGKKTDLFSLCVDEGMATHDSQFRKPQRSENQNKRKRK